MKKRLLCAALAALLTVSLYSVSASAASVDTEPSGARGTIKFDPGDWESSKLQFYIYDSTGETTMYATKDGWVEDDPWSDETKIESEKIEGTKLTDGTFESFEFELEEGHRAAITFYDPDTECQTFEQVITSDAFGDTARLLPYEKDEEFPDYVPQFREAKFDTYHLPPDRTNDGKVFGYIFFDPGEWNSSRIHFFIFDTTEETTMYAKKDGTWTDKDTWGTKSIDGSNRGDGVFEYYVEIPDDHEVYVIFYDPDTGNSTYDCVLTADAINDTAKLTNEIYTAPSDDPEIRHAKFENSGLSTRLSFAPDGELFGETVHPNADGANEVAKFMLNRLGTTNKRGEDVVTTEKIANAISAFGTTAEDVWAKYQTYADSANYNESGARAVLFPDETKSESETSSNPKTDSNTNTSSSNESKVTSPKTGYSADLLVLPILFISAGAAAVIFAKRKSEE